MDTFAHGLWANAVFYKKYPNQKKQRYLAVLFGVLPDIISFAPLILYLLIFRLGFWELVGKNLWVVKYAEVSYNFTHSLVIFFMAAVIVVAVRKNRVYPGAKTSGPVLPSDGNRGKNNLSLRDQFRAFGAGVYWPMFGWGLHILIDIPSHKNFYETPFLYPISNYRFEYGTAWAHPVFMIINYSALAAVYLFWFLVIRKSENRTNPPSHSH